ncbi:MAG: hypothetical protein KDA77_13500, partial [Planctomycetaceae bacterium]|nr:hypothetical protein [Planctomycetaceae bacterium]
MTGFYFLVFSGTQEGRASANAVRLSAPDTFPSAPQINTLPPQAKLQSACETQAELIRQRISIPTNALIKAPYILIGDYETETLEALYRKAILPTEYALSVSYFDSPPDRPITIIA